MVCKDRLFFLGGSKSCGFFFWKHSLMLGLLSLKDGRIRNLSDMCRFQILFKDFYPKKQRTPNY